jgi:hypothetical protein
MASGAYGDAIQIFEGSPDLRHYLRLEVADVAFRAHNCTLLPVEMKKGGCAWRGNAPWVLDR